MASWSFIIAWITWEGTNVFGIFLQVGGVIIAFFGVRRLHKDANDGLSLSKALWEDVKNWRLRKKPPKVTGSMNVSLDDATARFVGTVTLPPMPEGPIGDQIEFLHRLVLQAFKLIGENRQENAEAHEQTRDENAASASKLLAGLDNMSQAVAHTKSIVMGGPNGEGLRWAAFGLSMTLVGLVLTSLAAQLG